MVYKVAFVSCTEKEEKAEWGIVRNHYRSWTLWKVKPPIKKGKTAMKVGIWHMQWENLACCLRNLKSLYFFETPEPNQPDFSLKELTPIPFFSKKWRSLFFAKQHVALKQNCIFLLTLIFSLNLKNTCSYNMTQKQVILLAMVCISFFFWIHYLIAVADSSLFQKSPKKN